MFFCRPADGSDQWTYRPPPPPVVTEQPKPQHFTPYDRQYPKTLESLAEKVHSFYPGTLDDRRSAGYRSMDRRTGSSNSRVMPRSGSDQHLPRVEYDYNRYLLFYPRLDSSIRLRFGAETGTDHPINLWKHVHETMLKFLQNYS